MIARIIEFSVRNRWLVILLWLGIALWGGWALWHTPVDAIPDLSENQVIVFADWMGRSPADIEEQVTYPLSVQLQGLAGVKTIRSSSEPNFSMITIIFDDKTDFYFARTRVLERLTTAKASLPAEVSPQLAPDATALGQIFWYTVEGGGLSTDALRAVEDFTVKYQLASIPGVAEVASVGGFVRQYQVDVDPAKLRIYNLPLSAVYSAIAASNASVGGKAIATVNSEYLIRSVGWLKGIEDLENVVVETRAGVPIRIKDVAIVQLGPEFRRSALEKNGGEAVGGVVMMRLGQNPLQVTEAIKQKIREIQPGLPAGVRIVPFYDRTRLIESAIHTVTGTLTEEMIIACVAILLLLTTIRTLRSAHRGIAAGLRSAFVVCVTLPMAVLISFLLMYYLDIPSNIMSLSGIAISIGILVDASVVMVENATHELHQHFGSRPVTGDTTEIVVRACRLVGRPIFFSVLIMLLSFLPIFAFGGQEGKLSHPLAFTKSFAMCGVALLAITLVPAMIPLLIRGQLSGEEENPIVRSFIHIYKPMLSWVIERPGVVWTILALIVGIGLGLARHLGSEFMPELNEGSIMDMPLTAPRVPMAQAVDDVQVRDRFLRSFPEVEQVVGKIGRAETATDPSPLDMVETIVSLRPTEVWPKRKIKFDDAMKQAAVVAEAMKQRGCLKGFDDDLLNTASQIALSEFDRSMRDLARRRQIEFAATLPGDLDERAAVARWRDRTKALNWELFDYAKVAINDLLIDALSRTAHGTPNEGANPQADQRSKLRDELVEAHAKKLFLWTRTKDDLVKEMDSELQMPGWGNVWTQPIINRVNMLATGVRTQIGVKVFGPSGRSLDDSIKDVQRASERIAQRLREVPGAVDVVADQATGKRYVQVEIDRAKAARYGVNVEDVSQAVEVAMGGGRVTSTVEGRQRFSVQLRYQRNDWQDVEKLNEVLVAGRASAAMTTGVSEMPRESAKPQEATILVPLGQVADVRIVDGPSMIKSENGRLRNYVTLNVRDRDIVGFVEEARRAIQPIEAQLAGSGMSIEWSGEFENQLRARQTLTLIFPMVATLILLLLYVTFKDLMDTMLVFLAVLGALAGAVIFQAIFGFNFSVIVSIGYVAAFGMATQTGVIMLVYLREAIDRRGGLMNIHSLDELKQAVIEGAVHRLRPKLLTEGVAIVGLVPMLWAAGTGADIMRPMAAPVLGGLLISDEVIDLMIPVLFYWIRKRRWEMLRGHRKTFADDTREEVPELLNVSS
jgi:Cu(I)/Ag(I) efflux system membrane protein CusA/SilA